MDALASVKVHEIIPNLDIVDRAKGVGTKGACLEAIGTEILLMSLCIGTKMYVAVCIIINS